MTAESTRAPDAPMVRWLHETFHEGNVVFRIGRRGRTLLAQFVGVGTLEADVDGGANVFRPDEGANAAHVEKVESGAVPALLRHLRGGLSLHASAVAWPSGAIVMCGPSGSGKSTSASDLCAHGSASLVADDAVAVHFVPSSDATGVVTVESLETASWLRRDSAAHFGLATPPCQEKVPWIPPRRAAGASRLRAICALVFDDGATEPQVRRLRGVEALRTMTTSAIRFAIDDSDRHRVELDRLVQLAGAIPVFELRRGLQLNQLPLARAALTKLFEESP
jgi:hypothetical protein